MATATLSQLADFLQTTDKNYWHAVLTANIENLALTGFMSTEDYIDIESIVFDASKLGFKSVSSSENVRVGPEMYIKFDFKLSLDAENECDTDKVHIVTLQRATFFILDSEFDVTGRLRDAFISSLNSTGLNIVLA